MHTNTTPWSFLVVRMTGSSLYGSITANPSNFPLVIWMAGPGQNKCCLISGMVKRPSSVTGKEGRKIESRWVNVNMTYRLPHDQHQELPHRGCPSWIIAAPLKKIVKDINRTQNYLTFRKIVINQKQAVSSEENGRFCKYENINLCNLKTMILEKNVWLLIYMFHTCPKRKVTKSPYTWLNVRCFPWPILGSLVEQGQFIHEQWWTRQIHYLKRKWCSF